MQTLLTNENQSHKRKHRAMLNITNLIIMKRKIISFVGLALFAGALLFNLNVVNNNNSAPQLKLIDIEAKASSSGNCDSEYNYCPYDGNGCIVTFSDGSTLYIPECWS